MYTECVIKYVNDDEEIYAIVKDKDGIEEKYDGLTVLYGHPKEELERAMKLQEVIDDSWIVVDVLGEFQEFDREFFRPCRPDKLEG